MNKSYPDKNHPLELDISLFLFEQELKTGDSDVIDWSIQKIKEIFEEHKEVKK